MFIMVTISDPIVGYYNYKYYEIIVNNSLNNIMTFMNSFNIKFNINFLVNLIEFIM